MSRTSIVRMHQRAEDRRVTTVDRVREVEAIAAAVDVVDGARVVTTAAETARQLEC